MKIIEHVRDVETTYLSSLGGKIYPKLEDEQSQDFITVREVVLATLILAVHGEIPARRPRGGLHWTLRFFVRRLVWHELDNAWEIEDRVE
jgi:hypothetical protein